MASDSSAASEVVRASIEARLDAVDRLLLGFIPRHERLAIMRGLEDRLRSLAANAPAAVSIVGLADSVGATAPAFEQSRDPLEELARAAAGEEPVEPRRQPAPEPHRTLPTPALHRPPRVVRPMRPRRSKLALFSTLLGVAAGGLLCATPLAYLAVTALSELLGETGTIVGLGSYVGLILLCSSGAIVAGLVALWRLSQLQPVVVGRGWAIAGLCAGPIPFAAASLMAMLFGFEMLGGLQIQSVASSSSDGPATADSEVIEGQPGSPDPYGPVASAPEGLVPAGDPYWSPTTSLIPDLRPRGSQPEREPTPASDPQPAGATHPATPATPLGAIPHSPPTVDPSTAKPSPVPPPQAVPSVPVPEHPGIGPAPAAERDAPASNVPKPEETPTRDESTTEADESFAGEPLG